MNEPPDPDELPDDTIVLGGLDPEPPRERLRLGRRSRWLAIGLAVALVATVAWLNRPGRGGTGPVADDPFDQGSRSRPLYPGAQGRLLFTVQEEPRAGEVVGETLWSIQLESGAASRGPLLPPMGTGLGVPAGPGLPPNRSFALGPEGTPGAGTLAFLAQGAAELGARTFVYTMDVGRPDTQPAPVAEGATFAWDPNGALLVARYDGLNDLIVERFSVGGASGEAFRIDAGEVLRLVGGERPLVRIIPAQDEVVLLAFEPNAFSNFFSRRGYSILRVRDSRPSVALRGWRVIGVGPRGALLVEDANESRLGPYRTWAPGSGLGPLLPGFMPERVTGTSADGLHFAAIGDFRGRYGLWLARWPNTPVILLDEIDPAAGESSDVAAFEREGRVVFFVRELRLWMVEVGSERRRAVPLPEDAAREVPSGPLVWVP